MMWLPQQQSQLTDLVQKALVRLCLEHVPFETRLELDGLVCINSDIGGSRQMVVKIHTVVGPKVRIDDTCAVKVADRGALQAQSEKSSTPISSNGLSRLNGVSRHHLEPRPPIDEPIPLISEARGEDVSDIPRPVIAAVTTDEPLPLWTQRAPQILKLLTKSEFPGSRAAQNQCMTPTDLSRTGPAAIANSQEKLPSVPTAAGVKSEPTPPEDRQVEEVSSGAGAASQWRCKVCHTQFTSFPELEIHMRTQHVRFVCRICLNSFTLSCNLRRHMKLHAGVRPHSCLYCPASFSRSTDLKIHMKKHPNAAPYHHHHHHGAGEKRSASGSGRLRPAASASSKTQILHECEVCGKVFASTSHLAEHRLTHADAENAGDDSTGTDNPASDGEPNEGFDDLSGQWKHPADFSVPSNGTVVVQPGVSEDMDEDCLDLSDTMREFAPLFQLPDAGSSNVESVQPDLPVELALTKATTPVARSKRKGMPIKHVEVEEKTESVMLVENGECENVPVSESASPDAPMELCKTEAGSAIPAALGAPKADDDSSVEFSGNELQTKSFRCQYAGGCATTWHGFAAYEQHYVSAHGGRYPCALCAQSFTSRNNRRRHADGHVGAAGHGRHQCTSCGRRFARADIIKEHRLTHTRSYRLGTCSKCGETCSPKKSQLLVHLKRCLAYADIDNDIEDRGPPPPAVPGNNGTVVSDNDACALTPVSADSISPVVGDTTGSDQVPASSE